MIEILRITTRSGTVYEIDESTRLIRRLSKRIDDGVRRVTWQWRFYERLGAPPEVGCKMVIIWPDDEPRLADHGHATTPATVTSPITMIETF